MRPLIVSEFVTLDGVMEAPGGEPGHPHSGWAIDYMSQEQLRDKVEEVIEPEQARYKLDEVLLTAARICESAGGVVDRAA